MSDEATEVRRLLAAFRDRPMSVDPERIEMRRRRVVPALREQVNSLALRRRHGRIYRLSAAGTLAVAAAAAAVAIVTLDVQLPFWRAEQAAQAATEPLHLRMLKGHMLHQKSGVERTIVAGQSLTMPAAGEFLTPRATAARLQASSGIVLDVSGASRVLLSGMDPVGRDRHVSLLEGKIHCSVPKLEPGAGFAVATPNARAVVHGTEFSVEVDSSEEGVTRSCVRVEHGVVVVHHAAGATELRAGSAWGCDHIADRASVKAPSAAQPRPILERSPARTGSARTAQPSGPARGTLAEETLLLQAALAAERSGQPALAGERLRTLLADYPGSPLAPEARQALERVSRRDARDR